MGQKRRMKQQRYSFGAIVLHWLLALALAFQLSVGLGLEYLGTRGFAVYQLHKSVGIAVLLLSLLRLGWRLTHRSPPALERGLTGWLAKAVHIGLYVFMIGAPLTGWLLVSTDRVKVPTLLFATIPWPHLPVPESFNGLAHIGHGLLGWLGIALIVLHVAGALRHQWLIRDGLMQRMAPGRGTWLLLALLVPAGWALGIAAIKSAGPPVAVAADPGNVAQADETRLPDGPGNEAAIDNAAATADDAANAVVAAVSEATAMPPVWQVQPGGVLAFSVSNGSGRIDGRFAQWNGDIAFDPDRPERAEIRITVSLGSATIGDPVQEGMLAGADFFDVAAFPRAVFQSTDVRANGPGRYIARGTLSLKGVTKPQTVRFTLSSTGLSRHVEGSATISRAAFGIGTGPAGEPLGPDVALSFRFDATGRPGA
jgi:cytochrome b561/polyisoprenoid-binding protein YceI